MKCPECENENPEGNMFCGNCGGALPQLQAPQEAQSSTTTSAQPMEWVSYHWKELAALAIAFIVIIASLSLIYSLPVSNVRVIVSQSVHSSMQVSVHIDGVLKASVEIEQGTTIIGEWAVVPGSHTVAVYEDTFVLGSPDFANTYYVGPFSTVNVNAPLS